MKDCADTFDSSSWNSRSNTMEPSLLMDIILERDDKNGVRRKVKQHRDMILQRTDSILRRCADILVARETH